MQNRNDSERLLIRLVCDHVIAHDLKSERMRSEVSTIVPLMGKTNERFDCCVNFVQHSVRSVKIVRCNVFPNFGEVGVCLRIGGQTFS